MNPLRGRTDDTLRQKLLFDLRLQPGEYSRDVGPCEDRADILECAHATIVDILDVAEIDNDIPERERDEREMRERCTSLDHTRGGGACTRTC